MDREYLRQHPELDELSKRVSLEQSREFQRKAKLRKEIQALLEKFYEFAEEDLRELLAKAQELKAKPGPKTNVTVDSAPLPKPREVG